LEIIRILIADDQRLILESLQMVIESVDAGLLVVGTAHDGAQAVEVMKEVRADVVLMDIRMPGVDGIEATRRILDEYPSAKIIMLTTFDDKQLISEAMDAGAVGYLLKDISVDVLVHAMIAAKHGVFPVCPTIMTHFAEGTKQPTGGTPGLPAWAEELTDREIVLLRLLKSGCSNKEIGDQLFLAEQTVKNYLSKLYEKIGTRGRSETRQMLSDAAL
jgi:DNA-binding NarL/FixJ family response regulator